MAGREVRLAKAEPGDLLFFRGESGERITHVAFLSDEDDDGALDAERAAGWCGSRGVRARERRRCARSS